MVGGQSCKHWLVSFDNDDVHGDWLSDANWDQSFYDYVVVGTDGKTTRAYLNTSRKVTRDLALDGFFGEYPEEYELTKFQEGDNAVAQIKAVLSMRSTFTVGAHVSQMNVSDWVRYYTALDAGSVFGIPLFVRKKYVKERFIDVKPNKVNGPIHVIR